MNAITRRYSGNPNPNPLIEIGDVCVDIAAKTVKRGGCSVELTGRVV